MGRVLVAACVLALATPCGAEAQQAFESVGSRALGMGGAFVAVADDATAAYWNPAGLANAGAGSISIEWVRFQTGNRASAPAPGPTDRSATFLSAGTLPLAISFTNLQVTNLAAVGTGVEAQSVHASVYGVTLVQSVSPGIVVGSTLKLEHGFAATGTSSASTVALALDQGAALTGETVTRFDLDVGVMINMNKVRVGVTAKNLRDASFPITANSAITMQRQERAGLAVLPTHGLTLAMDVDLDTVDLQGGPRRMIAFGGEDHLGRRLAVRGGVRFSLIGERNPAGSAGLSIALRKGLWLDGHYTRGGIDADRGFGVALRAGL